jgi:hypothetical protein
LAAGSAAAAAAAAATAAATSGVTSHAVPGAADWSYNGLGGEQGQQEQDEF